MKPLNFGGITDRKPDYFQTKVRLSCIDGHGVVVVSKNWTAGIRGLSAQQWHDRSGRVESLGETTILDKSAFTAKMAVTAIKDERHVFE